MTADTAALATGANSLVFKPNLAAGIPAATTAKADYDNQPIATNVMRQPLIAQLELLARASNERHALIGLGH